MYASCYGHQLHFSYAFRPNNDHIIAQSVLRLRTRYSLQFRRLNFPPKISPNSLCEQTNCYNNLYIITYALTNSKYDAIYGAAPRVSVARVETKQKPRCMPYDQRLEHLIIPIEIARRVAFKFKICGFIWCLTSILRIQSYCLVTQLLVSPEESSKNIKVSVCMLVIVSIGTKWFKNAA